MLSNIFILIIEQTTYIKFKIIKNVCINITNFINFFFSTFNISAYSTELLMYTKCY
jgi:hypothetical protein